jgi:hypothetical protein
MLEDGSTHQSNPHVLRECRFARERSLNSRITRLTPVGSSCLLGRVVSFSLYLCNGLIGAAYMHGSRVRVCFLSSLRVRSKS